MKLAFEQMLRRKLMGLMVSGCVGLMAVVANATPISAVGTFSGQSVDATGTLTAGNGSVTVVLNNLEADPTSAAQLISGVSFDVFGATGSGSLTTVNHANTMIDISNNGTGSYTSLGSGSLSRWKATEAGTSIDLTTLSGGNPDSLIIGPPDGLGSYDSANDSIRGNTHNSGDNPDALETATFTITIPGVTSGSTISDVVIYFGTDGSTLDATNTPSVPDGGSTIGLLGFAVLGLVFLRGKTGFAFDGKRA